MVKLSLKAARINSGLNQSQAAEALGIGVDTLSRYERGLSYPNVEIIQKMENLYNIHYDNLNFLPNNHG